MKNKLKICVVVICICSTVCSCKNNKKFYIKPDIQPIVENNKINEILEEQTNYVYITNTGKKYHREMCISLKYSKKECTLEEALEKGLTECKLCKPMSYK